MRRLSPHCSRIELVTLKAQGAELRLLHAMGWETANIHLATKAPRRCILAYLQKQTGKWLHEASDAMLEPVRKDWKDWKKHGYN